MPQTASFHHASVPSCEGRSGCPWLTSFHHVGQTAFCVTNAKLGHGTHLSRYPRTENLTPLFFAEAGAWEVAFIYEGDDVDYYLVFVEDSVYNDWYQRGQVSLTCHLDQNNNQSAGLENSTIK